ncbi:hypothetical protein P280DRAFT_325021 [Massarina eburnea CBS 473.64]|uniref:Uncharacterized protein n=1 Tax=Massarina eburnea CBS 473.64 TaxID=1395130 RepID=A0A6A6RZD5_9PLEO|nr:hypothetical protein P280DRAFT_325021 [Massarina eburnea CBS 473.64]
MLVRPHPPTIMSPRPSSKHTHKSRPGSQPSPTSSTSSRKSQSQSERTTSTMSTPTQIQIFEALRSSTNDLVLKGTRSYSIAGHVESELGSRSEWLEYSDWLSKQDNAETGTAPPSPERETTDAEFRSIVQETNAYDEVHIARLMKILDRSVVESIGLGTTRKGDDVFAYRLVVSARTLFPTLNPWRTGRCLLSPCLLYVNLHGPRISTVVQLGRLESCPYDTSTATVIKGENSEAWKDTNFVVVVEVDDKGTMNTGPVFAVWNTTLGIVDGNDQPGAVIGALPGSEMEASAFKIADRFEDLDRGKTVEVDEIGRMGAEKLETMPLFER